MNGKKLNPVTNIQIGKVAKFCCLGIININDNRCTVKLEKGLLWTNKFSVEENHCLLIKKYT